MSARILQGIARHRNGMSGVPFHVVIFRDDDGASMVAVVMDGTTEQTPCPAVAVFNRVKIGSGDIAFGSNSFRGDVYTPWLCQQIAAWENSRVSR